MRNACAYRGALVSVVIWSVYALCTQVKVITVTLYSIVYCFPTVIQLWLLASRDRARNTAYITCGVCSEDFQTTINYLSEPIDVYSDWVDACENANA